MKFVVIPVLLLILARTGWAETHLVPSEISTIQGAIQAAQPYDTILVSPGIYYENLDFLGKSVTVRSTQGALNTLIDGNSIDSVVRFATGEDFDAIIDGFTLTNGNANFGGGIFCDGATPQIVNNVITKNRADSGGGILCTHYSAPEIHDNRITDNMADDLGAGICCFESDAIIFENRIADNLGEGIFCAFFTVDIQDNEITGNIGAGISCDDSWGCIRRNRIIDNEDAGIYLFMSDPNIVNNVISQNMRSGVYCDECDGYYPLLVNNSIFNNSSTAGGGICCVDSKPEIVNTILWGNEAPLGPEIYMERNSSTSQVTIYHSDVEGGQAGIFVGTGCLLEWGEGMIDSHPEFLESSNADPHIAYTSPCRDAGSNSILSLVSQDIEGDPRDAFGVVDIGADEFHAHLYVSGDLTPGGQAHANFIGLPSAIYVGTWFSMAYLEDPVSTILGDWYLVAPLQGPVQLGPMPANGFQSLGAMIPTQPSGPYDVALQGFIGYAFTNLCILKVR